MIRLGLRENLGQFSLLVLVNAFVGAMVGMERSILLGDGRQNAPFHADRGTDEGIHQHQQREKRLSVTIMARIFFLNAVNFKAIF